MRTEIRRFSTFSMSGGVNDQITIHAHEFLDQESRSYRGHTFSNSIILTIGSWHQSITFAIFHFDKMSLQKSYNFHRLPTRCFGNIKSPKFYIILMTIFIQRSFHILPEGA